MPETTAETAPLLETAPVGPAREKRPPSLARRISRMLLFAFGLYLGMCALIAWQTVRPKNAPLGKTPRASNMEYRNIAFRSEDGTELKGWFIPAAPTRGKPRGVVVLCHGVDSDRTAMIVKADMLHRAGFAAVVFDFRGRGESAPALCTIGYREVDDLLAAIRWTRTNPETASLPLGVLGESQGGAVALMGTARSPEVRAVVAESAFARLDHAVDNHFRKIFGAGAPFVGFPVRLFGEAIIHRRCCNVSPVDEIGKIAARPILLIQDADDLLCPPAETAALLKAAGPSASLWTVPGADHIGAAYVAQDEFEKRVVSFFKERL